MSMPAPPAVRATAPPRPDFDISKQGASSAIDARHLAKLGYRIAAPEELTAMGRKPVKTMVIPYFDINGRPIDFCRYRYLEDPRTTWEKLVTQTKAQRYFQPMGTGLHAYFPPLTDWPAIAADPKRQVLITEGEKKAASATANGFPCIGLGGVDCFASRKDETLLLPELMEFKWEGREVVIVYDSDASTNPNVLAASVRLGRRLYSLGASVRIAALAATPEGAKQGLDDFILSTKQALESVQVAVSTLIERASAELFEREIALYEFNRQFVYVRDLDFVICREDGAMLKPDAFMRRAYAAAKHTEYGSRLVKDTTARVAKKVSTAEAWMSWDQRLTCKAMDFSPGGEEITEKGYNLWRGWPVTPAAGDATLWTVLLDKLFMDTPTSERTWFERWCAYPIANPGAKLKTSCLLWSRLEGTGKSTVLECLRAVYGGLYAPMNDTAVDLQWTDWLVNKLLVGVDDISSKTRDDHSAKWRNLVTSSRLTIQKRHTNAFEIDSHVNFIMTSNEPNALRLNPTDRRYFIQRVAEWGTRDERVAFFAKVYKWLARGGAAALMHHLMNLDLGDFDPDAPPPINGAKLDMQDLSMGPLEKWVETLKDAPNAVLRVGATIMPGDLWTSDDLAMAYNMRPDSKTSVTRTTMGMAISNVDLPRAVKGQQLRLTSGERVRLFVVRNADTWLRASANELRDHYEATRMTR